MADRAPRRILICTYGSEGDLLPYLAIAVALRDRGHQPAIASSEVHRARVEGLGIPFAAVRPDKRVDRPDPDLAVRVRRGLRPPGEAFADMFLPQLRESWQDTLVAARRADLVLSHTLAFAAPIVAQQLGIPWVSAVLNPLGYFSRFDPPALGPEWLAPAMRRLGPGATGLALDAGRRLVEEWSGPWRAVRAEAGLPPAGDPVFAAQHSLVRALALFSRALAEPQPDWPASAAITGFPFLDDHAARELPPRLEAFLAAGPPPLVFALGTTAVNEAGPFFRIAMEAASRLRMRAVLVTGPDPANRPPALAPDVIAVPAAPYGALFPHAAAVVHQAGIGTLAQAMRAGKPMLVVPFAHDQPDNAARAVRIGIARRLDRRHLDAAGMAGELSSLLADRHLARRSAEIGFQVRAERGAEVAADLLLQALEASRNGGPGGAAW